MANALKNKTREQLMKMRKDDLLAALIELRDAKNEEPAPSVSNADILKGIKNLESRFDAIDNNVQVLADALKKLKAEVEKLTETVSVHKTLFLNQQIAIEQLFARERSSNVIVHGLSEVTEYSDSELIGLMCKIVKCDNVPTTFKRIGSGENRPLLITCRSYNQRKTLLENRRNLKTEGEKEYGNDVKIDWGMVFIRKDTHPAIRKEWGRLRSVEKEERLKPHNEGADIRLDTKRREVLCNGIVIDYWKMDFFL